MSQQQQTSQAGGLSGNLSSSVSNLTNGNQNGSTNGNLNGVDKSYANKSRICRDFVRGSCRRKNCRYPHVLSPELIVFCHDYQNSTCPRVNCKFLHYTLQEEEYYRQYGEFPQMENNNCGPMNGGCGPHVPGMMAPQNSLPKDQPPPYSQAAFQRHDRDPFAGNGNNVGGGRLSRYDTHNWNDHPQMYRTNDRIPPPVFHQCEEFQAIKRPPRETVDSIVDSTFKRFREDNERLDIMQVIRRFEEEQSILRRRVEANEIKIAELRASNEYLMAQLRLSNQQCSTVVNPVTVTQTTSQPQSQTAPQVIGGVSIAPVQVQATPIVSIATPQTQIIAANSATPLAIAAANTSQGQQQIAIAAAQQSITSLTSTSQALQPTHAQQILGTSQITLTPVAPPPSMGLAINTSQAALAMSNATQPIISYPVMTHSILPH
ncbi:unnamed protein product [Hermetia illucens]|uniref:C3H1-type domain-containing protein n=1 Tax=Hermetia illucens TaxID=343691 RepID=A0A7R8V9K3_HERIL|nr:zinc finger CCCH domain-containing protein 10-like isoform X2 [Hermetia illucens]CAD7094060.1 unnamed protein product [Hermetia illucens]